MDLVKFKTSCKKRIRTLHNTFLYKKRNKELAPSNFKEFDEIIERSRKVGTMSDHLAKLFIESIKIEPKFILELGVGPGESSFVLGKVAQLFAAKFVSVDRNDCCHIRPYEDWIFIHKDDIEFANEFAEWCAANEIEPRIDILFLDTSHLFEHTLREIKAYLPFMSDKSKVFLHDTNLSEFIYRKDGSMDLGWNNQRGVIRALEEYFGKSFNEKEDFIDICDNWIIEHSHYCYGFTIMEKLQLRISEH
jgi:cephalosporin hydroxylase